MPPMLIPSPTLIDQSFPRNSGELRIVAAALGEIELLIQSGDAHLLITDALVDTASSFDWNFRREYALLADIYRLVNQWLLTQHPALVWADLSSITPQGRHPVPNGCSTKGEIDLWAEELGRLLYCHDQVCNGYCVGVACHLAFGGEDRGTYGGGELGRCFPLVGPEDMGNLEDAYEYELANDIHQRDVGFDDAYKHVRLLGASSIDNPRGGSHYKVRFPGSRSWTLDSNVDPIPDRFLKQLVDITGLPFGFIKATLLDGKAPRRIHRIEVLRGN